MLQVLITDFRLVREGQGTCLELTISPDLPALRDWREIGALKTRVACSESVVADYQRRVEEFLQSGPVGGRLVQHDESFPFRYGSGGVLPIVRWNARSYYCLFYRDIDPVGWNIANGATDTVEELLDPCIAIEREFCEELLIVNPPRRVMYRWACERSAAPAGGEARGYWGAAYENRHGIVLEECELNVDWVWGPDRLIVNQGDQRHLLANCFLNINALDIGIEIDRVAEIPVEGDIVVCDGEVLATRHINRPVGLFVAERMHEELAAGGCRFEPEVLFFDGVRQEPGRLEQIIGDAYLARQASARTACEQRAYQQACDRRRQYDLCPVTKNLLRRLSRRPNSPRSHMTAQLPQHPPLT